MTKEQIIEAVKTMTVLELNDLVKASNKGMVVLYNVHFNHLEFK
jgi:ribosomal protein L7/L12